MKIFSSFLNRLKRKSTQRFIPEIDALRFFAIIPVLLLHFGTAMLDENSLYNRETIDQTNTLRKLILNGGNGVILFFAISGFILALPFIGKKIEDLRFKSYFIRRLIRIEPPYIIAITLFLFVHIILNIKSISFLWERYFASFFYLHNIIYEQWSYILPVAWSLEIEVQFYLLMPIFLYLICLFGNQLWRYAIYICMFVFFILVDVLPGIMDLSDYMYAFIPGIAAADFYKSKLLKKNMIWDFVFMISLVIFFVYGVSGTLKGLLLFLIITSSLNLVLLRKLLSNNIVVIIGGMCYSLYL
ncbi:MAG: acyltransferase, partial [Flavobacteriaceae bacterium]